MKWLPFGEPFFMDIFLVVAAVAYTLSSLINGIFCDNWWLGVLLLVAIGYYLYHEKS